MPHSENVHSSVDVAIMKSTAITASPLSYSKTCDTLRPRRGQTAARRTDLGGKSFAHFLEPSSAPNGFEAEHVAEGRPASIKYRFRHSGFGESGGVYVAYCDVIELSCNSMRQLMQEVATTVGYLCMNIYDQRFFLGSLRHGQLASEPTKISRVFDLLSSGKSCKFFQAKIDAYSFNWSSPIGIGNFNADGQKPIAASISGEAGSVLNLSFWQRPTVEHPEGVARESECQPFALEVSPLEWNPARGMIPAISQERTLFLVTRLGVLLANSIDRSRVHSKLFAAARRKTVQIKAGRPFLGVLQRESLRIIAEIPNDIYRFCLSIQQAIQGFYAVTVDQNHVTHLTYCSEQAEAVRMKA